MNGEQEGATSLLSYRFSSTASESLMLISMPLRASSYQHGERERVGHTGIRVLLADVDETVIAAVHER